MPRSKYSVTKEQVWAALETADYNVSQVSRMLSIPKASLYEILPRLGIAIKDINKLRKRKVVAKPISKPQEILDAEFWRTKFRESEKEVNYLKRLRSEAFKLSDANTTMPGWTVKPHSRSADIPVLFTSDFQWGEVIDSAEMDGMNQFNLSIAKSRYRQLIGSTIDICENYRQQSKYPGFVYLRGGDSISGDIHDELQRTNEAPSTMQVMDLFGEELRGIDLLQKTFGKVVVISVAGNHGRLTKKPIAKKYSEWNFDFMLALMLEKACQNKNVTFITPPSGEAYFQLYGTRFLLTHGDRIGSRGGQGFIGPIATITRGAKKTRDAYAMVKKLIDWVLVGHFHTSAMGTGFLSNGSLPGYGEFAASIKASPEPPSQTLFFINRKYGLNEYRRLVLTDESIPDSQWFESIT